VSKRNLDLTTNKHGLDRLLHGLLCVKPDDVIGLILIRGEKPNGSKITRRLANSTRATSRCSTPNKHPPLTA
jgi:hypothetical protein